MDSRRSSVEDLLLKNRKYSESYSKSHSVEEVARRVVNFPSVIIVSCCDPRLIPEEFGMFSREEFVVVRNAGGRAEPAVRDIVILSTMTEITDVVIVHHVDCGMTHLNNIVIRKSLRERGLGDDKLDVMDFGEIRDLKQSVIDDMEFLRSSPYISKTIKIHGFVFDMLKSGRLLGV